MSNIDRRKFIKNSAAFAGICCIGSSTILQSCAVLAKSDFVVEEDWVKITRSKIAEGEFVIIEDDRLKHPVYVKHLKNDKYKAMLMRCTHNSCTVQAEGSLIVCPCHGGTFSDTGKPLSGPVDTALDTFKTYVDDNNVYIDLT